MRRGTAYWIIFLVTPLLLCTAVYAETVGSNILSVVHKGSNGITIAFPDVCSTPTSKRPLPIPYPNIALSSDTAKGSKKVKVDSGTVRSSAEMKLDKELGVLLKVPDSSKSTVQKGSQGLPVGSSLTATVTDPLRLNFYGLKVRKGKTVKITNLGNGQCRIEKAE